MRRQREQTRAQFVILISISDISSHEAARGFLIFAPTGDNAGTMQSPRFSRRRFLTLSTSIAAGIYVAPAFLRGQSLNSKLNIAMIGVGGKGGDNYNGVKSEELGGICDVDSATVAKAAERSPGAKQFRDYRKMFDELKSSEYDAVIVSTPDHHHFPETMRALKS